ncbi:SDR family oxidoreductase [Chthonobacter rhizosphaerae]|uniref:SDR family oxidoreductase n=1 Tax=Chthonobacter rhizosphaerae TaxID=2735553 RepID=UPI0015EFA5DD|nr:SDR family oxidoreductase [Chthonobacter rhizosphaerae]
MPDQRSVLILGGGSDIGRAAGLAFAAKGWTVRLAGRDLQGLTREADDIRTRTGATVSVHRFDALDTPSFDGFLDGLPALPDAVVSAVGVLGDQGAAERDVAEATRIMRSNFEGPALILGLVANRFEARGSGTIVGISSVAGDRGRATNYIYGSAKAAFTAFLSGLRNRLARKGVHVVTVKPGFVRTRMTAGMALPGLLTVDPDVVGNAIYAAVEKRTDVVYVARAWQPVMFAIRSIPERLFKTMKI